MKYRIVKVRYDMYWFWNRDRADWVNDPIHASIYGPREHARVISLGDNGFWQRVL